MLRNKRVRSYSIARYPEGQFTAWKRSRAAVLARSSALSAALLLLLESCDDDGVGVTGPPPIPPGFLTENEGRAVITRVFRDNGIRLNADVPVSLYDSRGRSVNVLLDGYNDSLKVGYEYAAGPDSGFTPELLHGIEEVNAGSGPYVGVTERQRYEYDLEMFMQAFIDTLKAHGRI